MAKTTDLSEKIPFIWSYHVPFYLCYGPNLEPTPNPQIHLMLMEAVTNSSNGMVKAGLVSAHGLAPERPRQSPPNEP